ncbi:hypothetical protein [Streptomyces sp. UG1]|uniref:hypothetical protein n=1 Tax=Streptomyces sp. UG1 TaxID=3417652 RepID=UPI003CF39DA3
MDSEEHVCPVCGQPVDTVVKRHKTLGAWVPTWVGGPCKNPDCEAYAEEGAEQEEKRERHGTSKPGTPTAKPDTPTAKNS